jgi:hypothetical protein
MKLQVKAINIMYDTYRNIVLNLTIDPRHAEAVSELNNEIQYDVEIKKHTEKRSLDANAYYQVLLDALKDVLKVDRDKLHRELLRRYGQTATDSNGNKLIYSILSEVDGSTVAKYCEIIGHGEVDGKAFTHWRVLKGSSEMDTREFSILLEGLIDDCHDQGIETMTPAELAKLKGYTAR